MITDPFLLLFALLGGHFFLDIVSQGDFVHKAKNPNTPMAGVPWWYILLAHGTVHGTWVALVTGLWWLGVIEIITHCFLDYIKCKGHIDFTEDQNYHILLKLIYFVITYALMF